MPNLSHLTSVIKEMTCSKADGWEKDRSDIQKPSNVVLQELKCNKGAIEKRKRRQLGIWAFEKNIFHILH